MKPVSSFLILLVAVTCLFSCSVQRRLHMPGHHVSWKGKGKTTEKAEPEKLALQNELQVFIEETGEQDIALTDMPEAAFKDSAVTDLAGNEMIQFQQEKPGLKTQKISAGKTQKIIAQKRAVQSSKTVFKDSPKPIKPKPILAEMIAIVVVGLVIALALLAVGILLVILPGILVLGWILAIVGAVLLIPLVFALLLIFVFV